MSTENTQQPSSVETEKAKPGSLHPGGYTPIYLCEHPDGPVGWTRTAEESVEWAMRVRDPRLVKITKLYEIKSPRG